MRKTAERRDPDGSGETSGEPDGAAAANGNDSKDSGSAADDPGDKAAKTGDETNAGVWMAFLTVSAVAAVLIFKKKRMTK